MKASARTVSLMDRIHWIASVADILGDADLSSDFWIDRPDLEKTERQLVESIKRDERLWENVVHAPASHFPIEQYPREGEVEIHVVSPRDTDEVWIFQVRIIEDWVHVRFMMRDTSDKEGYWMTAVAVESLLGGEMLVMSDQWDFGGGYAGHPEDDPPTFMETVLEKAMRDLGIGSYERARRCRIVEQIRRPSARDSRFMQKQVHDFTWTVETEGLGEAMSLFEE